MKKVILGGCLLVVASMFSSCAGVKSPLGNALFYTNVKAPVTATTNSNSTKIGTAKATNVLGLVATGDASIQAAAKSAGITKIYCVDEEGMSILGLFSSYTTYVYGE